MSDAAKAARRLLERARGQRLEAEGALVMATAGAVVEADEPEAGFRAAERLHDRGLSLLVAAAAEVNRPAGRQDRLAALARSIPSEDRAGALACAERFLALIDTSWAAALIEQLVGVQDIRAHGALGLFVAARADFEGVSVPAWVAGPPDTRPLYARQLAADSVARMAARGRITDTIHPALAPLHESPPGRFLLPAEASAYLAAAAVLDSAWALDVAEGLLQTHTPTEMEEALFLTTRAAVASGLSDRVAAFARRPGFIIEQSCWAQLAARSGAMEPDVISALARELSPRVADELDSGRELIAGMPLMTALACAGASGLLFELAAEWRTPPPVLVDYLFHRMTRHCFSELLSHEQLAMLFKIPEVDWNCTYGFDFGWWLDAGLDQETRLLVCRDVLALASEFPWIPEYSYHQLQWPTTP